jgi:hypothetical protein
MGVLGQGRAVLKGVLTLPPIQLASRPSWQLPLHLRHSYIRPMHRNSTQRWVRSNKESDASHVPSETDIDDTESHPTSPLLSPTCFATKHTDHHKEDRRHEAKSPHHGWVRGEHILWEA